MLILAGISISMLSGDNEILNKVVQAKDATRGGKVQETVALEAANNAGAEYLGGTKKTRAQIISELHANGKLTDAEVATLEESNTITIGGITIDFSVLGSISGNLTLGDVYTDEMIGQELSYTANSSSGYTGKWIVFGKDTSGNILITTELPIDNVFTLKGGAYHFFRPDSTGEEQADNFIKTVPKLEETLPPVVDIEFYEDNVEETQKQLQNMLNKLEEYYGKKPIIYATYEAYDLFIANHFNEYYIWIRDVYFKPKLKDNREWTFWQYSNRTRLKGYRGKEKRIDMNVFNGDMKKFEELYQ